LPGQLSGIHRLSAMLGQEELASHLGPHPGPICSRQPRAHGQAGCGIDRPDVFRHLEPERAYIPIGDLERRTQLSHFLEVADSEVRSFQLLLSKLGQRMQTASEQRSDLLRGHWVASGQAVDPAQAGTDPHPRRLTAFGVVGRQPI
jgi:hypothetical protein